MQQSAAEPTGIAFRLQRRFSAPRENVFRAWTDPAALKLWWCPHGWTPAEIELDLRVGGMYRVGMRRPTGGASVYVYGTFVEVNVPAKLAYTWRWENAFAHMPETRVTVEFIDHGTTTQAVLTHERLPEIAICLQHRNGWSATFDRIEQIL